MIQRFLVIAYPGIAEGHSPYISQFMGCLGIGVVLIKFYRINPSFDHGIF